MLLLVQSYALDKAPYINCLEPCEASEHQPSEVGSFSYWFDKPWFHTEGRLVVVLIIPSSWGSQLGGHLHAIRGEAPRGNPHAIRANDGLNCFSTQQIAHI
jgi:hypothetical protein